MMAIEKGGGKIGLVATILVGINSMIGAGILALPSILACTVGPAGILSCFLSIFVVLCIGLSLGRAAEIYPGGGWSYLYPSKWAGHGVGMLSAFCYVCGIFLAMGFLVQQAGVWGVQALSFVLPNFSSKYLSVLILIILAFLVVAGAQASSWLQYIITGLKVPLILTAVFCWFYFDPKLVLPFMPYGAGSILAATPVILFAFFGFETVASLYPIVKDPNENIPRAYAASIIIAGIVYVTFFYGILFAIPKEYFGGGLEDTLSNVLSKFFPDYKFLSLFVLFGGLFAIIGTLHSILWSASELLTSVLRLSKSKQINILFKKGFWNSKVSVIVSAFIIFMVFLVLRVESLISLTAALIVPAYVLSVASVLFVKNEWKSGRNAIALLGLLGGFVMFYFAMQKALETLL